MRRVSILAGLAIAGILAASVASSAASWPPASAVAAAAKPKKGAARKDALELCVAAMGAGAYETMPAPTLADYCVDLAVNLAAANYDFP